MSAETALTTAVRRPFAGADRKFQLCIGQIKELEQVRGAGIGEIYLRVASIKYSLDDLRETIRLGLVGGGMPDCNATALVKAFVVDGQPMSPFHALAVDVLVALFEGVDERGNFAGVKPKGSATSDVGLATSPPSTSSAVPPDSHPGTSTH